MAAAGWWRPSPGIINWEYQLASNSEDIQKIPGTKLYIIDMDAAAAVMADLRSGESGVHVVCYFSAGTYEPERADDDLARGIRASDWNGIKGSTLEQWGEQWLDIRSAKAKTIMQKRMDYARQIGCDGIDPDNMDGFDNDPGFPLTKQACGGCKE